MKSDCFTASPWPLKSIGEICLPKETTNPKKMPEVEFDYIDISSVDSNTRSITNPKHLIGENAPSRARKKIRRSDVILATTRPYLKSIAMVDERFDGQICSTGFAVLRATDSIDPEWLFHSVTSNEFISQLTAVMRGANYPAVRDSDVNEAKIPVPPLEEQRRIVARIQECLSRVEEMERLQAEVAEDADWLSEIAVKEIWKSDEIAKCDFIELEKLGKIVTGNTPSRKREDFFGGDMPWITPGDMNVGREVYEAREFLSDSGMQEGRARVMPPNSVAVVCIGATIGKVAMLREEMGINQQINAVTFGDQIDPEFGFWACRALYSDILANASQATLPILNKGRFSKLRIPVPSMVVQKRIAAKLNAVDDRSKEILELGDDPSCDTQILRNAILRQAFAGEL